MIAPEVIVKIRHLYFAEHWKIGTIASQLGLHHDTVRAAIGADSFNRARREQSNQLTAPYLDFVRQTLKDRKLHRLSNAQGLLGRGDFQIGPILNPAARKGRR